MKTLKKYAANLAILIASFFVAVFLTEGFLTIRSTVKYGGVEREKLITARRQLRDDILGGTGDRDENRQVLHPFFGYTYNPKDKDINNFGFYTKHDISLENSGYSIKNRLRSELLVIGIFGGSFAGGIGSQHEYFEEKLRSLFPDKTPIIMNFGLAGTPYHSRLLSMFISRNCSMLWSSLMGSTSCGTMLTITKQGFRQNMPKPYTTSIKRLDKN